MVLSALHCGILSLNPPTINIAVDSVTSKKYSGRYLYYRMREVKRKHFFSYNVDVSSKR